MKNAFSSNKNLLVLIDLDEENQNLPIFGINEVANDDWSQKQLYNSSQN